MKILTLMVSIVFAFAAFADARSLIVGAPDGSGNVTITIGGTGTQNQTLIAAWSNGDRGENPLDWTEYADAGTVAPSDTSKTFQIPAAWRAKSGAVRFFLMSGEKPYRTRYDYLTRPDCADGGLYLNTDFQPDTNLDITVKVQSPNMQGGKMAPFGIAGAVYFFGAADSNSYYYDFFGARLTTATPGTITSDNKNIYREPPPLDSNPHVFRMNREGLFIDGCQHLAFDQSKITGTTTKKIHLFGRINSNVDKQVGTTVSIYYAKIVTNGVTVLDLVPVAAPSGKLRMWNRGSGATK